MNLVRTHSTGQFSIAGAPSSSGSISSDSDVEMDTTQSRPSTPADTPRLRNRGSTILIDPTLVTEVSRRPTIEQNMAFAALQQSQDSIVESDSDNRQKM